MEILNFIKPSRLNRQKRRDKRLSEELIECRRGNGGDKNKKLRDKGSRKRSYTDFYSETSRFRSSIKDNRDDTYFEDNLEPLIRYLQSNCGTHWDQVYSKLSKQLDKRSTQGMHVLDHLWDLVILNTKIEKGNIIFFNRRGKLISLRRGKLRNRFYVHPTTGILIDHLNKKQVGPFPKKAKWKRDRDKRKYRERAGICLLKKQYFLFEQVNTIQNRLIENQVYDLKIEKITGDKRTGYFRIRLNRIIKSGTELSLRVTILKSNHRETGQTVILDHDNVRSLNQRAYQRREYYMWNIYEPGHFYFEPKKGRETFNYQY